MVLADRQDYSNSSGMGIRESGTFKFGFNVQSSAQEWVDESRRLLYLRTTNNISNSIYNGTTPLRAGNLHHEPSEDHRSSNYPSLYSLRERVPSNSLVNRHVNTDLAKRSVINQSAHAVSTPISIVNNDIKPLSMPSGSKLQITWHDCSSVEAPLPNISNTEITLGVDDKANHGYDENEHKIIAKKVKPFSPAKTSLPNESKNARKALVSIYDKVLVVDNIESARSVVQLLTTKYKSFVHACDTEVFHKNPA